MNVPRPRPGEDHDACVLRFAHGIQHGRYDRTAHFLHQGRDISIEVLTSAGPETADEHHLHELHLERRFPWCMTKDIQTVVANRLDRQLQHHYCGEDFDVELQDPNTDNEYLILIRRRDGKRYHVEVSVDVQELS